MSDMKQRRNKQLVSFEKLKHFAKVYSSLVLLYSAHQSNPAFDPKIELFVNRSTKATIVPFVWLKKTRVIRCCIVVLLT